MSQPARVYRILIAAPSDVADARDLVDRSILQWNNENFQDRRVVLLPLDWETPEGSRRGAPKSILRREVAGGCDLFVGVFWTRLSTVPGHDVSPLLEQIESLRSSGVPVLLFFSKERAQLDEVDPTELARLKDFRRNQDTGVQVEEFVDLLQFRDQIQRHLDQQIRILLASESLVNQADTAGSVRRPLDLAVTLADPSSGQSCGQSLSLEAKYFDIRNFEQIPDYQRPDGSGAPAPSLWGVMYNQANKDYYRNYIKYVFQGSMLRPVRLILENIGLIGLRDVRLEVTVTPSEGSIFCLRPDQRLQRPDKEIGLADEGEAGRGIGFPVDRFSTHVDVACLQPQRSLALPPLFLIGADRNVTSHVDVLVYADSLAVPIRQRLVLDLRVSRESVDALEFFEVLRDR